MSFGINYRYCLCGKKIREDDDFCSDLCEAEAESRREDLGLIRSGDQLQSAASRLAEWVREQDAPYEVAMAALEAQPAIEGWTEARALTTPQEGNERCGQIMVGSGGDTYDPACELPAGHSGSCKSTAAIDQHRLRNEAA